MSRLNSIRVLNTGYRTVRKSVMAGCILGGVLLSGFISSCKTDQDPASWSVTQTSTIGQFIKNNKEEYSKAYSLLDDGKMLNTLYAYNPNGDDYTLFLPTNEAIDRFMKLHPNYGSFDILLKDTSFVKKLTRYHTLNRKIRTNDFPDGALIDKTLTGDRLIASFYSIDNNQLIKMNNVAPLVKSNLKMTNGYVHVISEVLQPVDITGYDWLRTQPGYSIMAKVLELAGIKKKLTWSRYTLIAEPDSIYRSYGINSAEDLASLIGTPGVSLTTTTNTFYQFAAFHVLNGEFYMNDFAWGSKKYPTLSGENLTVAVGMTIRINPGNDTYGKIISPTGEETIIDYIRPINDHCNILTSTGPVHAITDLMYYEDLPLKVKGK